MTYFTLNHTKSANMLPVLPPGREEAGGTAAVALSNAHIRRKTSSKVIFRKDQAFIRSVGLFQKLLKEGCTKLNQGIFYCFKAKVTIQNCRDP